MAFEDLKNKLRERAALFEEGGLPAALSGHVSTSITLKVRRSVYTAATRLEREYPQADLLEIIDQHAKALGEKLYNREAKKFWYSVRHYCHCKALKVTSDGLTILFEIVEDAGKGWPPFEKPALLGPDKPSVELPAALELPAPAADPRSLPARPGPPLPASVHLALPHRDEG